LNSLEWVFEIQISSKLHEAKGHTSVLQYFLLFSFTDGYVLFLFQDILKDARDFAPLKSVLGSEILSQSEFMSSNGHPDR
jgi:hypothetical protein